MGIIKGPHSLTPEQELQMRRDSLVVRLNGKEINLDKLDKLFTCLDNLYRSSQDMKYVFLFTGDVLDAYMEAVKQ